MKIVRDRVSPDIVNIVSLVVEIIFSETIALIEEKFVGSLEKREESEVNTIEYEQQVATDFRCSSEKEREEFSSIFSFDSDRLMGVGSRASAFSNDGELNEVSVTRTFFFPLRLISASSFV